MDILDKLTPKQKQAIINELNDLWITTNSNTYTHHARNIRRPRLPFPHTTQANISPNPSTMDRPASYSPTATNYTYITGTSDPWPNTPRLYTSGSWLKLITGMSMPGNIWTRPRKVNTGHRKGQICYMGLAGMGRGISDRQNNGGTPNYLGEYIPMPKGRIFP